MSVIPPATNGRTSGFHVYEYDAPEIPRRLQREGGYGADHKIVIFKLPGLNLFADAEDGTVEGRGPKLAKRARHRPIPPGTRS